MNAALMLILIFDGYEGDQQGPLVGVWASVVKVSAAPQEATKLKTTDR